MLSRIFYSTGCYRTALELCKLLLRYPQISTDSCGSDHERKSLTCLIFVCSLSPDEDPLCVLLMIDFYALHSGEYDFLIRLYEEWEVWTFFQSGLDSYGNAGSDGP